MNRNEQNLVQRPRFQDVLIHEFQFRIKRNSAYSLRAFARDLGLASSGLSRILNGQQGLSLRKAKDIAKKLELNQLECEHFCSLVEAEHSRSKKQRELATQKLEAHAGGATELSLDYFKAVSDWHYFSILALTEVSDFESTPEWVAERLNISVASAQEAIDRLIKIELLEYNSSRCLKKTNALVTTPSGVPSRSIKSFHQQILKKAETALFDQSVSEREFAAISFAMNPEDLDWAKNEMQEFRRKLTTRLAKRKVKKRLYHLSMQLFALDKLKQNGKGKK